MSLNYTSISKPTFNRTLARYSSTAPSKLLDLDTLRYETIPATLAKRTEEGEAFLKKEEVESLVEWKLYVFIKTSIHSYPSTRSPRTNNQKAPVKRSRTRKKKELFPPHAKRKKPIANPSSSTPENTAPSAPNSSNSCNPIQALSLKKKRATLSLPHQMLLLQAL